MHPALTQQMQAARLIELTASRHAADRPARAPQHRFPLALRRRRTALPLPHTAV
jgi:hypothetical protein